MWGDGVVEIRKVEKGGFDSLMKEFQGEKKLYGILKVKFQKNYSRYS